MSPESPPSSQPSTQRDDATGRARVVVIGGGFAGFFAGRALERRLPAHAADLTLISATDHLCYSPLLPEVAAGRLDPRRIAVPLHGGLKRTRVIQGQVFDIDFDAGTLQVDCDGQISEIGWDRIALTLGSVTRVLPTPGLTEHGMGLKTLAEAQYIRDHVLRQLEQADTTQSPATRRAMLTFVVVGAGYAGTETAAQLQRMTQLHLRRFPRIPASELTWILVDHSHRILPELGPRLARAARSVVHRRGMQVRLGTSVTRMTAEGIELSDGAVISTRTVLWTVGVTPAPLVGKLGFPVNRGRLVVDTELLLRPDVWAAGDDASAENPFSDGNLDYPPTAQHAQRQGTTIGVNIAASLGHGKARAYRHRDLGLVADLGGLSAAARPLGIPLTGVAAKLVTKGYHLFALPSNANRLRVGGDWLINLVSRPVPVQLGARRG